MLEQLLLAWLLVTGALTVSFGLLVLTQAAALRWSAPDVIASRSTPAPVPTG